jgi:hypothetical protein
LKDRDSQFEDLKQRSEKALSDARTESLKMSASTLNSIVQSLRSEQSTLVAQMEVENSRLKQELKGIGNKVFEEFQVKLQ